MSFSVGGNRGNFGNQGFGGGNPDQHTVYSSTPGVGVGGRAGNACCASVFGIAIFLAAFPLLVWNEGSVVTTTRSLDEGMELVVSIGDGEVVAAENDGALVHIAGAVSNRGFIADEELGVGADALRLQRTVSMYQWKEHKRTSERKDAHGTRHKATTYTYTREWSSTRISSSSFNNPHGHENPTHWPVSSSGWKAHSVALGAYTLSPGLQGAIGASETLPLTPNDLTHMAKRISDGEGSARIEGSGGGSRGGGGGGGGQVSIKSKQMGLTLQGGVLSSGRDLMHPAVGDIRVSYTVGRPTHLSVIAKQVGKASGKLAPYKTRAGDTLEMLDEGAVSATDLFSAAHAANTVKAWCFRALGWFLMFLGINMLFSPLTQLAGSIPLLGGMLSSMVGTGACCAAGVLAASFALVTIASAWMAYRPMLAATIVAVVAVPWWNHWQKGRKAAAHPSKKGGAAAGGSAPPSAPPRASTRSQAGARKEKF